MAKELKTSADGRKCKFPNCKHLLSIYIMRITAICIVTKRLRFENVKPHITILYKQMLCSFFAVGVRGAFSFLESKWKNRELTLRKQHIHNGVF